MRGANAEKKVAEVVKSSGNEQKSARKAIKYKAARWKKRVGDSRRKEVW
jgi:hypothetical protein